MKRFRVLSKSFWIRNLYIGKHLHRSLCALCKVSVSLFLYKRKETIFDSNQRPVQGQGVNYSVDVISSISVTCNPFVSTVCTSLKDLGDSCQEVEL